MSWDDGGVGVVDDTYGGQDLPNGSESDSHTPDQGTRGGGGGGKTKRQSLLDGDPVAAIYRINGHDTRRRFSSESDASTGALGGDSLARVRAHTSPHTSPRGSFSHLTKRVPNLPDSDVCYFSFLLCAPARGMLACLCPGCPKGQNGGLNFWSAMGSIGSHSHAFPVIPPPRFFPRHRQARDFADELSSIDRMLDMTGDRASFHDEGSEKEGKSWGVIMPSVRICRGGGKKGGGGWRFCFVLPRFAVAGSVFS